jgi:hypothetical protein
MVLKRKAYIIGLLLFFGALLVAPKLLFACNLMDNKVQTSCCCKVQKKGCEHGGGCTELHTTANTDCCDSALVTPGSFNKSSDAQPLTVIETRYSDLPTLPPTTSVLLIASNRVHQKPLFNDYRSSGQQLYLTTARFRE